MAVTHHHHRVGIGVAAQGKGVGHHLVLLVAALPIGSALALYLQRTESIASVMIPAVVDCEVTETFANGVKSAVAVKNTSNIPAYLRLRVVSYWQNSKGETVGRAPVYPTIYHDNSKWIYDEAEKTYYYIYPVDVGKETPNLLQSGQVIQMRNPESETSNGVVYNYYHVVEFIAEAIQAEPADAVAESWNVVVDGTKITGLNG